jgi:hypothetical protein
MKLEIIVNEGDDLSFLRVISGHAAVARDHPPKPKTRAMADRIYQALESVLGKPSCLSKGD